MPDIIGAIAENEADQSDFSIGPDNRSAQDSEDRLVELDKQLPTKIDAPEREHNLISQFQSDVASETLADLLLSIWLYMSRTRTVLGILTPAAIDCAKRSREAAHTLAGV